MADEKLMKRPYFAKGSATNLTKALAPGGKFEHLDKALYYFALDTKQWILVDVDKTVHVINGQTSPTPPPTTTGGVKRVDELPSILDADVETLYLLGDVVYSFNGSTFVSSSQDVKSEIGDIPQGVTVIEYINDVQEDTVERAKEYLNELLDITVYTDD